MPYPIYEEWKPTMIQVSTWVLAISASMILGMLSFSGMLVIWPTSLTCAIASCFFAIIIEVQIFKTAIGGILEILTDTDAYKNQLTGLYLQEKLADFDRNRNLLLMKKPSEEGKKQVCEYHQVVMYPQEDGTFNIGFRNQDGKYAEKSLEANDVAHFFEHKATQEQYLDHPKDQARIKQILSTEHRGEDRVPESYPLLMKAYISQCAYVRRMHSYVHNNPENEENLKELRAMSAHLETIERDICENLFADSKPELKKPSSNHSICLYIKEQTYYFDVKNVTFPEVFGFEQNDVKNVTFPEVFCFEQNIVVFVINSLDELKTLPNNDSLLNNLANTTYDFHHNEFKASIEVDRAAWKKRLDSHTLHSRLALFVSAMSGFIMGIGMTYLIMDSLASLPWLTGLSLSFFPLMMIGSLALLAGIAHGLLIYNSLNEMILENTLQNFLTKQRAHLQDMNLKKGLELFLVCVLFIVALLLTICSAGTWLTLFHKNKPLFTWINWIPNGCLNMVIPILIGISTLPFSIQSILNTIDSWENNPILDRLFTGRNWRMPRNLKEASDLVVVTIYQQWIPAFLGISYAEFEKETRWQTWNLGRIFYRLLFGLGLVGIYIGHCASAGVTGDQIEGVPAIYSFLLNFLFEVAEDWDWIWEAPHKDLINTSELLKERSQKAATHDHGHSMPMHLLHFILEPILCLAAVWDGGNAEEITKRYQRIKHGHQPEVRTEIPIYRKQNNFKLFLFKSGLESSLMLRPSCGPGDCC